MVVMVVVVLIVLVCGAGAGAGVGGGGGGSGGDGGGGKMVSGGKVTKCPQSLQYQGTIDLRHNPLVPMGGFHAVLLWSVM